MKTASLKTPNGQNFDQLQEYLQIFGMFETKNGSKYSVANKVTQNIFDWKQYNKKINYNQHGFLELQLDISDVDL